MKGRTGNARAPTKAVVTRTTMMKRRKPLPDRIPDDNAGEEDAHPEVTHIEGGKARTRLDRPARKKYADGGAAGKRDRGVPTYPGVPSYPGEQHYPGVRGYPGIGHYAAGGDVSVGLENFRNIARQFSSPEVSAPPIPALKTPSNLASIPLPYADQIKNEPHYSPAEELENYYRQQAAMRSRYLSQSKFADGGGVAEKRSVRSRSRSR